MQSQELINKKALDNLADLGGRLTTEDDIVFSGKKFVIPETMRTLTEASDFLQKRADSEEEEHGFSRDFNYRPWDGARATANALRKAFGAVVGQATYSFFGKNPPQFITIRTGVTETEQVPWGAVAVPGLKNTVLYLGSVRHPELGVIFQLTASGPRKNRFHLEGLFRLIEDELTSNSMYRGQAFDGQEQPEFLDLSGVDPTKVIYSDEVMAQLRANIWASMEHMEACEKAGIPFKRAVLLEGPYGTGKTLAAYLTAQIAVRNEITFIMCRPGRDSIADAMATARLYQPAVVFFEDVDIISSGADNTADGVSALLDTFDGLNAKGNRIMAILTTNHVEHIHKGMVRPGRLDAIVSIHGLDAGGVQRMIEATVAPEMIGEDLDYEAIYLAMNGYLPAFVKEAIDRAKRYSLSNNNGEPKPLVTSDLVLAAEGLRFQFDLMNDASELDAPDALSQAVAKVVDRAVTNRVDGAGFVDSEKDEFRFEIRVNEDQK